MKSKGRSAAVLMTTLLMATLIPALLPRAGAMPVVIASLEPTSGPVGTPVRIMGEIDTPGGAFQVLWDGKTVRNDSCPAGSKVVNSTFRVPPSIRGEHNVTLRDVTSGNVTTPFLFTVTTTHLLSPVLTRIREGLNTSLTLSVNGGQANMSYMFVFNVTDPAGQHYTTNLSVTTNSSGSSRGTTKYFGDFPGAHTDYVGTYRVTVNQTIANATFMVGLTDATEYKRLETVHIRGSGYRLNETVTVSIAFGSEDVHKENRSANSKGVLESQWKIPANASLGAYAVRLRSATEQGTIKPVADVQDFTVVEFHGLVQTKNLDGEPVADVTVEVSDAATLKVLDRLKTNGTGWAEFLLKTGNYTFMALWKDNKVEIGRLSNQTITGNVSLVLECKLAQIGMTVRDRGGAPISFVNVTLAYNYTTRDNRTIPEIEYFEVDPNGILVVNNTLAGIEYRIEARRYGYLFNETLIKDLKASCWVDITCPTYTLFVHVLGSKQHPIPHLRVEVYEWTVYERSIESRVTNETGSAVFHLPLGRYKVSVLNQSQKLGWVSLNETVLDLFEEEQFLLFYCKLLDLNLSVAVVDFFGSPFPNVLVRVEREGVEVESPSTGSDGRVSLHDLIGGGYSISIYLGEVVLGVETLRLDASKEIVFKVDKYVVVGGNPMETSQLITLISVGSVILLVVLALKYKKIWQIISGRRAEETG